MSGLQDWFGGESRQQNQPQDQMPDDTQQTPNSSQLAR